MHTWLLAACLILALTTCATEPSEPSKGEEHAKEVGIGSTADIQAALAALPSAEVLGAHEDGVPYMIRGRLGSAGTSLHGLSAREAHAHAGATLASIAPVFRLNPSDLVVRRITQDEQGHTHIRYAQTKNGLPVVGHELILHVDPAGTVYAANGSARDGEHTPAKARLSSEAARAVALGATPGGNLAEEAPRLVYVRSGEKGRLVLAFEVIVTGELVGTPLRDHVFINALDGSIVGRFSDIHTAQNRAVYSANNTTTLPGTLKRSEGSVAISATGDDCVDENYMHLGTTYQCYYMNFGRDSYDNAGAQLRSSVHYSTNYTNAFWNGTQLVYGDSNGVDSAPLCKSLDVTVHELTHAVTSFESNLTYSNESGALNEGLSDIFAAYCGSWRRGWMVDDAVWMMGDDVWTPNIPGDAVRYMANPTQDGSSKDYYPERYTGTSDNGGVHWNSGIANLAFKLLSTGGTHPRGKTTTNVTGIGIQKAGQIFYKANRDLMTASTTFAQAKTYTEQAATQLGYSTAEVASVSAAWQAVGVGVPVVSTALTNGVTLPNQAASTGAEKHYYLDVPASKASSFVSSGGTGDADLYVRIGAQPTTSLYNCRPYLSGNNETCNIAAQTSNQRMYVMLRAYSTFSGVRLKGAYSPLVNITSPTTGSTVSGTISVSADASDSLGIDRVDFYASAIFIGTDNSAPYSINWDTTAYSGRNVSFTTRAYDKAGNAGNSDPVSVSVQDMTAPTVSITSPTSGTVSGPVSISANASDNVSVSRVEFYAGATPIGTDSTAPYSIPWDTTAYAGRSVSLTARAYDATGNVGTSAPVSVTVLDITAPTVSITSPDAGTVSGTISISTNASDNVGVTRVEFYADATLIGITKLSPYSINWDTTSYGGGTVSLTARAYDEADNVSTSAPVSVTVLDITAPTVSITAPDAGTVSGTISISANASDNVGVKRVEFYADATLIGITKLSPYSINWDTTSYGGGTVSLTARAYDEADNVSTSAPVSVIVLDITAPTASITSPDAGTVSGTVSISANASDNVGVTRVEFYADATLISSDDTAPNPYSVDWNTTAYAGRTVSLTARAYDATGNEGTSAPVSVTVRSSTSPTVFITSPTGGTVSGTISISAKAFDNVGIAQVDFHVGFTLIGSDRTDPYSIDWDTTPYAGSTVSLTATARNRAGNSSRSIPVSVSVQ